MSLTVLLWMDLGEKHEWCQQDGFCFYPGICCRPLRSRPPCAEPQDLHSLQVWASLCAEVSGAQLASVRKNLSGVSGREHSPQREFGAAPTLLQLGRVPARDTDLSEYPPTSGVDLSPIMF